MSHPNLRKLRGRDPACTFPVRTFAQTCPLHADCVMISHWEQRDPKAGFTRAWHSHAHASLHIACRIGDATPVVEDHTASPPKLLNWTPMCADCHAILGHDHPGHHGSGIANRLGTLLVHADHPRYAELAEHPLAQVHSGDSYRSCMRCAADAAACEGCRQQLDAQEQS